MDYVSFDLINMQMFHFDPINFFKEIKVSSSGSKNFGEGGPRNMKYKPLFLAYFLQARGGHGPLGPPWIRYWVMTPKQVPSMYI